MLDSTELIKCDICGNDIDKCCTIIHYQHAFKEEVIPNTITCNCPECAKNR